MAKAQSSLDFLVIFIFFLVLFVLLFQFFLRDAFLDSTEKQLQLSARTEAEKVAFAVESVFFLGNGSQLSFYLPSTLAQNTPYNITVVSGVVFVRYSERLYTHALSTTAVNSSVLTGGLHVASQTQGVVSLV